MRKRRVRPDVITTVTYRRIRGKLRTVYNVRFAPLETDRFRWGIPCGRTLVQATATRYAEDISEYIDDWMKSLYRTLARGQRG